MENRIGKCFAFWSRNSKTQILIMGLIILLSLFKGSIYLEALAIWLMIGRIDLFSDLQITLPFSRKSIWKTYAIVESGMFVVYLIIKCIQYKNNSEIILLELFFVLMAHAFTAIIPRNSNILWTSFIIAIIVIAASIYIYNSYVTGNVLWHMLTSRLNMAVLIFADIVMMVVDIYEWIKQGHLMIGRMLC